jgi:hypothetical protein
VEGEVVEDAGLEVVEGRIGDACDILAGLGETAGVDLEAGEVDVDALTLDFGGGDLEAVGPGVEGVVGA